MIDRRLNDKGKNWRHVIKALNLLDYCIHCGSENVVLWCKDNLYVVKTLREFHYIDENGRDQGASIRSRAKEITSLLLDDERLRSERANRSSWKKGRRAQGDDYGSDEEGGIVSSRTRTGGDRRPDDRREAPRESRRPSRRGSTPDDDLARALAESQRTAEEEARMRQHGGAEDEALRKAIALSEEEQKNRDFGAGSASGTAQPINLIDTDTFPNQFQPQQQQQQQMQPTGYDLFGNAIYGQQQPTMNTGVLQNAYATGGMFDQQPNNQFQQQQQQFQAQPQQQQYTGFQAQQPQQQQYTGYQQQNDFSQSFQQQQQQPAEPLQPLKTGSNNPFAKHDSTNGSSSSTPGPSLNFMSSNNMTTQSHPNQQQQQQQQSQISAPKQRAQVTGGAHPELNNLLASGDGLDTYGNTGETRIPAQHTRDTFMNARLQPQATANNNPFVGQQYTGIPSTQIQPALTGYGFGNAPQQTGQQYGGQQQQQQQQNQQQQFGQQQYGQYGQQQPQQQQYGGGAPQQSLIDL